MITAKDLMSEEELNQELSTDELKEVAGGHKNKKRFYSPKNTNVMDVDSLAAPFIPGGAVLSAKEKSKTNVDFDINDREIE